MDWDRAFKHAINSIHHQSDFSKLGKELSNLTEFYIENKLSGYENEYDEAIEKSSIMKTHFKNMGHPSMVSEPSILPKIGEIVDFDKLTPVFLPKNPDNYENTVIVCLRHFL